MGLLDKLNQYRIILDDVDDMLYSSKKLLKSKEAKDLKEKIYRVHKHVLVIINEAEPPKRVN